MKFKLFCSDLFNLKKIQKFHCEVHLKFSFSEKAKNFCKISTVDLSYVVTAKSNMEISQNFVAFSEYMQFTRTEEKIKKWESAECKKIQENSITAGE